jgi:hypothetical protein
MKMSKEERDRLMIQTAMLIEVMIAPVESVNPEAAKSLKGLYQSLFSTSFNSDDDGHATKVFIESLGKIVGKSDSELDDALAVIEFNEKMREHGLDPKVFNDDMTKH